MNHIEQLKKEHPGWCFTCGKYWLESNGIHTCHNHPLIGALVALVERLEGEIQTVEAMRLGESAGHDLCAEQRDALEAQLAVVDRALIATNRALCARVTELDAKLAERDIMEDRAFRRGVETGFSLGLEGDRKGYTKTLEAYSRGIHEALQEAHKPEVPVPSELDPREGALCERCGSEMMFIERHSTLHSLPPGWHCPLDPRDCRIKELERQLEEANKQHHTAQEREMAFKASIETFNKAGFYLGEDAAWRHPTLEALAERDEARSQLEEAKANALIEEEQLLAVLPEDFGAVEYIKSLGSQLREAQSEVNRLKDELDKPCKGCGL